MKAILQKINFLLVLAFLFFQVVIYSQAVVHTYAINDSEYSIKNNFSITTNSPYQLSLALESPADGTYLSLAQSATGYDVTLVSRDASSSHHVTIVGEVKDGAGQFVSSYTKKFTVQQQLPASTADWMSGKWGVRYGIFGGVKLDNSVTAGANYYNGITQIVDELNSVGYVITNLTNNAHGYHFTLRDHPYIDIANEIHPDFVPSLANEQIILDAITAFKNKGLKVILYIAGDGPSATGGTPDNATYKAAWQNYYNTVHGGNEGVAWRLLCKGFVERFAAYGVDGYWVDHATSLPGGVTNFVNMLKGVDPNLAITVNDGKNYLSNKTVGSDGTGTADYKVINMFPTGTHSDFTTGHPTPLSTGAAPNSWAYEEFTFKEAQDQPWTIFDGKRIVRHWWGPMRASWTTQTVPLLFDAEQAYRFVRTVTDAGGAFSWSNTLANGSIPQEEFDIFKIIDQRMLLSPKTDYVPYKRPLGAYLKEEVRWDGGAGTSNWHDAANWTTNVVPTISDDVVLKVSNVVTVGANAKVKNILIEDGGTLNVWDQITFQISGTVTGVINYVSSNPLPPAPGIVSKYLYENNPNDAISDNHGTLIGDAGFTNSVVKEGDYSLYLDGTGDEVDLMAHVNDFPRGGSKRTITGWFNTTSTAGSILNYGTEAAGERFQIIANNSELSVSLNGHKWGSTSLSLSAGWHHFAVVLPEQTSVQSDKFLLYVDGVKITSTTLAGTVKTVNTGNTFAFIGRSFNGYLDDIRIYSIALSLAEIQTVINEASGPILVSSLTVSGNQGATHVFEHNSLQMVAAVLPANATDPSISWSVTNGTGSATIDASGLLTGVTAGTVTVTAVSNDGSNISNQVVITVDTLIPVTSISVQGFGGATAVELGKTLQMEAVVLPENASIKTITWSTEAEGGFGTIDANGAFIGNNDGSCYIRAIANDNSGTTGIISINVVTVPLVTSITVTGNGGVSTVAGGSTLQMQTSVLPANANNATVTWSVVNGTGTATINSTGVLTGVTAGTVTVKAMANDGSAISGQKVITVQGSASEVTIYATEDAYVWDRFPTFNYGTIKLLVRDDPSDLNRYSYVKFDLTSLPSVNTAKFRLTLVSDPGVTRNFEAFLVTNDSWTETGITWATMPATGVSLGTATNNGATIEWDITSTVISQMSANGILTIKIVAKDVSVTNTIYSREEGPTNADKPRLVINESSGPTLAVDSKDLSVGKAEEAFIVYPNPTTNKVFIKGLNDNETPIEIYNSIGQVVKNELYNSFIDLSSFETGIYYLKVLNLSEQKTIRIIKK